MPLCAHRPGSIGVDEVRASPERQERKRVSLLLGPYVA